MGAQSPATFHMTSHELVNCPAALSIKVDITLILSAPPRRVVVAFHVPRGPLSRTLHRAALLYKEASTLSSYRGGD